MTESIRQQLWDIEACLKQLHCWQQMPPSPLALQSPLPFMLDTLSLPQWLQFILLPRMHALLDAEAALPQQLALAPYAEEALKDLSIEGEELLGLLRRFDQSFAS